MPERSHGRVMRASDAANAPDWLAAVRGMGHIMRTEY
jgi:hypothetical protein